MKLKSFPDASFSFGFGGLSAFGPFLLTTSFPCVILVLIPKRKVLPVIDYQIVLVIILTLLTINLIVVGIYVVTVLKEFRETIKKMNRVLDNAENITDSVAGPITAISSLTTGIVSSLKVLGAIKDFKKGGKEGD